MAGPFQADYVFQKNNLVVLRHKKGKFLRIKPNNNNALDENGGTGKWARWNIELNGQQDGLQVVKLRHNASGKYLRIYNNGLTIDVGGGGGKWTRFKVHKTGNNSAKLESCELPGKYPAVQQGGPAIGTGGPWTEFSFFRQGGGGGGGGGQRGNQKGGGPYINQYYFNNNAQVVLCGFFGKYLRCKPGNFDEADGNGGTGGLARWNVVLDGTQDGFKVAKFQNTKNNKYLRIMNNDVNVGGGGGKWTRFKVRPTNGNSVKLESCELPGKYVATQPRGVVVGTGGKYTEYSVWSNTNDGQQVVYVQQVQQPVQVVYAQPQQQQQPPPQVVYAQPQVQQQPPPQTAYQPPEQVIVPQDTVDAAPAAEPQPEGPGGAAEEEKYEPPKYDASQIHPQPLANPRPSILPAEEFNDEVAKKAAKTLREAMKGLGTNEKKIINVTNGFSHAQRMKILETFNAEFKRDLIKDLKSELSGDFEKLCIGFWLPKGRYDAEQVNNAVEGLGFSTKVLNEVICTRTPKQLQEMQQAWWKGKSMIDRIKDETDKGHGNYCNLLVSILEGKRAPNGPVDQAGAKMDAEVLNRFLSQEKESAAKEKFVEIFTTRSWVQIREISGIFQDVSKKYTLNGAIKKAFGDGDTSRALQTIDEFASQPYDYWAKKLREAMKGLGTDDDQLRRVLVSRAEVDLRDIGVVFGQRYGDGKTLNKWIKDDTRGDYEKLCLAVCGLD